MRLCFLLATNILAALSISSANADADDSTARSLLAPPRRRSGPLHYVSAGVEQADCSKDIVLQLFSDFPRWTFKAETIACKTGTRFVGSVGDDSVHITLVPGRGGGDSFGAVVRVDDTGNVYPVSPNANDDMFVQEQFQIDLPEGGYKEIPDGGTRNLKSTTTRDEDISEELNLNIALKSRAAQTLKTDRSKTWSLPPTMLEGEGILSDDLNVIQSGENLVTGEKKHVPSNLRHRKLWGMSVSSDGLVRWDCRRKRKDTVCWKKTSTKGSVCRNGPANQEIITGSSSGTCSFNIPNWECGTEYKVRVHKNFFNYLTVTITSGSCAPPPPPAPTPKTEIDLLVVWTASAECRNSFLPVGCTRTSATKNNILTRIDTAIQSTNAAYDFSKIYVELNLAHGEILTGHDDVTYFKTLGDALDNITFDIQKVKDLRDEHCADMVHLVSNLSNGPGGVAWVQDGRRPKSKYMFSNSVWWGIASSFILAQ